MSWRAAPGTARPPLPTWLLAATLGAAVELSGRSGRRQPPPWGGGRECLRQPGLACAHGEWWHRHGEKHTWGTPTSAGRARCPHCLSTKARAGGATGRGPGGGGALGCPAGELGGGTVHPLCGHCQGCAPGSEDRGAAGAGALGGSAVRCPEDGWTEVCPGLGTPSPASRSGAGQAAVPQLCLVLGALGAGWSGGRGRRQVRESGSGSSPGHAGELGVQVAVTTPPLGSPPTSPRLPAASAAGSGRRRWHRPSCPGRTVRTAPPWQRQWRCPAAWSA